MSGSTDGQAGASPLVVAVDMGYGHLRAARALAQALGTGVMHVDEPPLVTPDERRLWDRVRAAYEWTSRVSQAPLVGRPFRWMLDTATDIPRLHPYRDLSHPTFGARALDRLVRRGLGRGLVARIRETGAPMITTFYSPAIAADRAGLDRIWCLVTDSDINRVWAPLEPARTRIRHLAPSPRVMRRLRSYGVLAGRIAFTGFPLPGALLGGPDMGVERGADLGALRSNLAARLVRLDPTGEFRRVHRAEVAQFLGPLPGEEDGRPPLVTFAVGGAGAQAGMARRFLPGFRRAVEEGRLRLALVAGARVDVADRFQEYLLEAGLSGRIGQGVELVAATVKDEYFARFEALLARTDVLWTKPSELVFYGALGLPLLLAPPVGVHEHYNRRWAQECGAGIRQRDPHFAAQWIADWLEDGTLAAAAWAGFRNMPQHGLHRILAELERGGGAELGAGPSW